MVVRLQFLFSMFLDRKEFRIVCIVVFRGVGQGGFFLVFVGIFWIFVYGFILVGVFILSVVFSCLFFIYLGGRVMFVSLLLCFQVWFIVNLVKEMGDNIFVFFWLCLVLVGFDQETVVFRNEGDFLGMSAVFQERVWFFQNEGSFLGMNEFFQERGRFQELKWFFRNKYGF